MTRPLTGLVLVTGTDTGVGKTVVTAALAACATAAGRRVGVVKPAQTGTIDSEPSDIEVITRLAAPAHAATLATYPEPLAPLVAARRAGRPPLALPDAAGAVRALVDAYDLVLVEGAGGLLVPLGEDRPGHPWTLPDLPPASGTAAAAVVVVARAGLGTLNHTALTLEALHRRGLSGSVVIGAWPAAPEPVHRTNLELLAPDLAGVVPAGVGEAGAAAFRRAAPDWLAPHLYGTWKRADVSGAPR